MNMRKFFLVSLALVVLAVSSELISMSQYGRGAGIIARSVGLPESERAVRKLEAQEYRGRGNVMSVIGLAFALASFVFVVVSAWKREPAWRSITFALLVFYILLQFVMA